MGAIEKSGKIYIAGHAGMVGAAIMRNLKAGGWTNIITRTSKELDLRCQSDVEKFFTLEKPRYVFLAAARVGGIYANDTYPAEFAYDNLAIELNVIHSAWQHNVKKLLFLGSSCIYPRMAPQPMPESCLLTSALEKTNEAYALAKIMGLKLCEYYNRQYGTDFISVMPTNLYGPGDNYHPENSHVLPAMIRRFHEAKEQNLASVVIWGSGEPLREFLHVDDLAQACIFLMEQYSNSEPVNIGSGIEMSISSLARLVADIVGYKGNIEYDISKPDGTPRKLLDVSKLHKLGWKHSINLRDGIQSTYQQYIANYERNVL